MFKKVIYIERFSNHKVYMFLCQKGNRMTLSLGLEYFVLLINAKKVTLKKIK